MKESLISSVKSLGRSLNIMEVCGTHTVSIQKNGIRSFLGDKVNLVSGPGCPVCVTETDFIDKAVLYLRKGYHIFTFGDMLKVPGSISSLIKEEQSYLHTVYSPLEVIKFAKKNPKEKILFLSIGFETTIPLIGALVKEVRQENIDNVYFLSSCKCVPPALSALMEDEQINLDGFLLPGHVSAVIGINPYKDILLKNNIPGVVAGFTAEDIIESLNMLLEMIVSKEFDILIQYKRVVSPGGNKNAQQIIEEVFSPYSVSWRGLGLIPDSGLRLSSRYKDLDIEKKEPLDLSLYKDETTLKDNYLCKCGEVIKGKIKPWECELFRKVCNPQNPVGPCMVSSEGACSAYYKYRS